MLGRSLQRSNIWRLRANNDAAVVSVRIRRLQRSRAKPAPPTAYHINFYFYKFGEGSRQLLMLTDLCQLVLNQLLRGLFVFEIHVHGDACEYHDIEDQHRMRAFHKHF